MKFFSSYVPLLIHSKNTHDHFFILCMLVIVSHVLDIYIHPNMYSYTLLTRMGWGKRTDSYI